MYLTVDDKEMLKMEITMMCDICVGRDFCNWNCKEYPNCFQTEQEKQEEKEKEE